MFGRSFQYLKKGKARCGKVFPGFAEQFNGLVDFCRNIKGDADIRGDGHIKVDRTRPDHPVIRLVNMNGFGRGGGGSVVPIAGSDNDCFSIRYVEASDSTPESPHYTPDSIVNCYYSRGAICRDLGNQSWDSAWDNAAIALRINPTGSDEIVYYATVAAMLSDTMGLGYTIRPLYNMQNGEVAVDFRKMPSAQMTEVL